MGRLEVLKIDSSEVIKIGSPYQFHLETETTPYTLQGNTEGLEKYDGQKIEVTGTVSPLKIYPPIFNVVSYKPIIEPRYDVLQGLLTVLKPEPSEEIVLDNPYKFQLETEKGAAYSLIGDTKGLEQYNGQTVEVKGNYVPTLLPQYPGLFNVVSYTPIVPVPTPVPTPVSPSNVHTIISEKPLGFSEPISGAVGNFTENLAGGSCTISWVENTGKAFFNAKLTVINDENQKVDYEFELATVKISGKDSIKGLFNVKRNGELVAKEISGELYGLNQPVGSYFKFYSSDTNWHMSAYITNRIDF